MKEPITPIMDENAERAFKFLLSRERLADPARRKAVIQHRTYAYEQAEAQVKSIDTTLAAAEIALNELRQARERAVDVLVDAQVDLQLAKQDEQNFKDAA